MQTYGELVNANNIKSKSVQYDNTRNAANIPQLSVSTVYAGDEILLTGSAHRFSPHTAQMYVLPEIACHM